jgi:DNA-binding XRE family transcriptional regulator
MTAAQTPPTIDSRQVRLSLGISRDRMGRLLEVTSKTIGRLEDEHRLPAQPAVATRLARLKELTELGLLVYTPEGFARFMSTPLPVFGGLTALQLIERGETERVFAELAATYEGVPA